MSSSWFVRDGTLLGFDLALTIELIST